MSLDRIRKSPVSGVLLLAAILVLWQVAATSWIDSPNANPMSIAPTNPALGSAIGSRVVTTTPTRTHTIAAAAKKARFAVRSRASMTIESRPSGPSDVAQGRISRAMWSILRSGPLLARPDRSGEGRERWTAAGAASSRVNALSRPQRAMLAGQMSRKAQ